MKLKLSLILLAGLIACALAAPKPPADKGNKGNGNGNAGPAPAPAPVVPVAVAAPIVVDDKGKDKDKVSPGQAKKEEDAVGVPADGEDAVQPKNKGQAKKLGTEDWSKPQKSKLSKEEKDKLKSNCERKKNGCKGQSDKAKAKKAKAKDLLKNVRRRVKLNKKGKTDDGAPVELTPEEEEEIEQKTIRQLEKTQLAKKAILASEGLDDVEPEDDGVWQEDIFLTEAQADRVIAAVAQNDTAPPPLPPGVSDPLPEDTPARKKRFALFLDEDTGARWDKMPIPVVLDEFFSDEQKAIIMTSLADIESKTCIRFQLHETYPLEPYVYYVKEDYAAFCGLSNVGRTGDENYIWLNFDEYCEPQINGTIIHETLHTLGVEHAMARYDRDQQVALQFDNIDPQAVANFAMGDTDSYTAYGIKYDIYSIMHYSAKVGVFEEGKLSMQYKSDKPNLVRYFTNVMGQRDALSSRDADLLRRMYCMGDCRDTRVWCGWWADVGYCETSTEIMIEYCPASCGFCPNKVNIRVKNEVDLWGYDLTTTTPAPKTGVTTVSGNAVAGTTAATKG